MDEPAFNKAIPGTEALAGALKDTFGAFRSGLGITEPVVSVNCEGCGAPLSGHRKEVVRCEYCDRETQLYPTCQHNGRSCDCIVARPAMCIEISRKTDGSY